MKPEPLTPEAVIALYDAKLKRCRELHQDDLARIRERADQVLEAAIELGGLIQHREELVSFLGVSNARVSQLLGDDRIRQCRFGFSLADAERIIKNRRPGRPRWDSPLHRPARKRR